MARFLFFVALILFVSDLSAPAESITQSDMNNKIRNYDIRTTPIAAVNKMVDVTTNTTMSTPPTTAGTNTNMPNDTTTNKNTNTSVDKPDLMQNIVALSELMTKPNVDGMINNVTYGHLPNPIPDEDYQACHCLNMDSDCTPHVAASGEFCESSVGRTLQPPLCVLRCYRYCFTTSQDIKTCEGLYGFLFKRVHDIFWTKYYGAT